MRRFKDLVDQVGQIAGPEEPFDDPADDLLSDEAIEDRKRWIIAAGSELFADTTSAGESFPTVLCRLYQDPGDPDAWGRVARAVGRIQIPPYSSLSFTLNVLARIYYQFFLGTPQTPSTDFEKAVTNFPIYLTPGTENTAAMKYTSGYLFGKAFPDSMFVSDDNETEISEADLAEKCKNRMYHYGQKLFKSGMHEYLSPTYHGLNTAAWLNIVDFAGDENGEVKDMAKAILDWMLADYALNYHHGLLLPPLERYTGLLTTNKYLLITDDYHIGYLNAIQRSFAYTRGQWTGWLYWGGGNTPHEEDALQSPPYALQIPHGMEAIRHAVSGYIPDRIIRNIGAKRVKTPYMVWQSHGNAACLRESQKIHCGVAVSCPCSSSLEPEPKYRMRSAYVARDFSIGVLYRRMELGDPNNRTGGPLVSVAWKSSDPLNWLTVVHPYWHTARKRRLNTVKGVPPPLSTSTEPLELESYDWVGASPFGQAVHWENACVAVFDIPDCDPYLKCKINTSGSFAYYSKRVAQPIQAVYVYFPDTVAITPVKDRNVFLMRVAPGPGYSSGREVYIAVRPFCAEWPMRERAHVEEAGGHEGFQRLAIPGSLVGLAMEVGSSHEYGSIGEFWDRISEASLDLSAFGSQKLVTYESTRGHVLRIRHRSDGGLPPADWLPEASVNGATLEFDSWPVYQSPYVTCQDRVLDVNDGQNGFTITWDEGVPHRQRYQVQV